MEVNPGYKQTEEGMFPEDWDIAQLGHIADVEGGYAFSSKAFLASGTYQVVKMSNLYGGTLDLERSASFLNELTEQERHYLLRPNHIILTLTGTTGKRDYGYSYMVSHEQNLLLNQRVARVVVPENSCASYVSLQLQSSYFLNQFYEVSKGGTGNQTNVGTQDVVAMRIPVPPLPEQRAIATALSDVDGLLGGLDRLIAKKRDLKQATMQQLLTGQTRLPDFHGEWEVQTFAAVLVRLNAKAHQIQTSDYQSSGRYPVVDQGKEAVIGFSDKQEKCLQCPEGGVIVFGDHTCIVKFIDFDFLVGADGTQILQGKTGQSTRFHTLQLQYRCVESTGYNRHFKFLKEREFVTPPLPEQTAIAEVLTEMDAELAKLTQRRDKTRALKQAMMQELLTGRTRLIPKSTTEVKP